MTDVQAIARLIQTSRFPLNDEKRCQVEMAKAFDAAGIIFRREVRLGPGDIIDFMIDDIGLGIEVKIKGAKRAIYHQIERYCAYDDVRMIMLVSNVAMGIPASIDDVPVYFASLAKGWM